MIAKLLSSDKWEAKTLTVIRQNPAGWHKIIQICHKSCELRLEEARAWALIWHDFPNFIHWIACCYNWLKMKNSSRRCITSHLESCRLNGKRKTLHTHPIDRTNVKPAKGHSQLKSALLHLLMMLLVQHTPLCVLYTCFQCCSAPRHLSLTSKPREPGSLPHDMHFSLPIWSMFNKYQMGHNVPHFTGHMFFSIPFPDLF